jgi:hypothetical protein
MAGTSVKERGSEQRTCTCGKSFKAHRSQIIRGGGKYCSPECYHLASRQFRGERKGNWRGDNVGYAALHDWVRRNRGAPTCCEHCGTTEGRIEWANKSKEYRRDLEDWLALCKACHWAYDMPTCDRGHERNAETTYVDKAGYPHCRPCRNERLRLQRRGAWTPQPRRSAIRARFG